MKKHWVRPVIPHEIELPKSYWECGHLFVNDAEEARLLAEIVLERDVFAFDIEYDQYNNQISLLQISFLVEGTQYNFVIDVIEIGGWKVSNFFKEAFESRSILKIVHGPANDQIWLKACFNIELHHFYDTQQNMLKVPRMKRCKQRFDDLVSTLFQYDFSSKKAFQTADWSKRPLSQSMIDYSTLEVHFLLKTYELLSKELISVKITPFIQERSFPNFKSVRKITEKVSQSSKLGVSQPSINIRKKLHENRSRAIPR